MLRNSNRDKANKDRVRHGLDDERRRVGQMRRELRAAHAAIAPETRGPCLCRYDGGDLRRASGELCAVPCALFAACFGLGGGGVEPGQVVATILPNIPAQAEAHFGVPACGAVLNTINTRLDVDTVGYILDHGEARVLLVDTQFVDLAEAACATLDGPPRC